MEKLEEIISIAEWKEAFNNPQASVVDILIEIANNAQYSNGAHEYILIAIEYLCYDDWAILKVASHFGVVKEINRFISTLALDVLCTIFIYTLRAIKVAPMIRMIDNALQRRTTESSIHFVLLLWLGNN